MKRIISGIFICATILAFANCKKAKDALDCTVDLTKLNEAKAAFEAHDGFSKELCISYKAALEKVLNGDCKTTLTNDMRETFEKQLAALSNCNPA